MLPLVLPPLLLNSSRLLNSCFKSGISFGIGSAGDDWLEGAGDGGADDTVVLFGDGVDGCDNEVSVDDDDEGVDGGAGVDGAVLNVLYN